MIPLLEKRRLYYFFLRERLERKMNVLLYEFACLTNCENNKILGRKNEKTILRQLQVERDLELTLFHLKRVINMAGKLMDEEDSMPYAMYKRAPVSPCQYRKKEGRRKADIVRLVPYQDPWFKTPYELIPEDADHETKLQIGWRNEAKRHCPDYSNADLRLIYGSTDRVQKAVRNGRLIIHRQSDLLQKLRDHWDEKDWWYFTNETLKTRGLISTSKLKRYRKRLNRTKWRKRLI